MKPVRWHGAFRLSRQIDVQDDALGRSHDVRFEGLSGTLTLPVSTAAAPSSRLSTPGRRTAASAALFDKDLPWGYRSAPNSSVVQVLRLSLRADRPATIAEQVITPGTTLARWCDFFLGWCSVWDEARAVTATREGSHTLICHAGGKSFLGYNTGGLARIALSTGVALTHDQVHEATRRANRGVPLPLEHQLILAAEESELLDLRGVVIDATSAVEVAFASSLRAHLQTQGKRSASIEESLARAKGVAELADLYCETKDDVLPVSPGRIRHKIAGPRNRAVHAGVMPSPEESAELLDLARRLVIFLSPVPPCP